MQIPNTPLLLLLVTGAVAQPSLRIVSPADGAVVKSGQKVTVLVAAKPERGFQQMAIIGVDPIGISVRTGPPWRFSVEIPLHIVPREYGLTADGIVMPGHRVSSKMITIQIERPDFPLKLVTEHKSVVLHARGAQEMIGDVAGVFADSPVPVDLSESTVVQYSSNNPNVAAVNRHGVVTAKGEGFALITIAYGPRLVAIPVKVDQQPGAMVVH